MKRSEIEAQIKPLIKIHEEVRITTERLTDLFIELFEEYKNNPIETGSYENNN